MVNNMLPQKGVFSFIFDKINTNNRLYSSVINQCAFRRCILIAVAVFKNKGLLPARKKEQTAVLWELSIPLGNKGDEF